MLIIWGGNHKKAIYGKLRKGSIFLAVFIETVIKNYPNKKVEHGMNVTLTTRVVSETIQELFSAMMVLSLLLTTITGIF